ncbi:hypothetical protein QN277_021276 [Acacia crassicarpa]|uniref:Growth-regulating factor n=1 Tax=Acacia crassicarpa TaxID=499986 RepID=A0AAE1MSX6_9FABA|nr:hypothetical protein QN277_021276 [Acacia crassicarpa]
MDLYLKQWRNQDESVAEEQHSAKMPKLVLESHQKPQSSASALPLFVPQPNPKVSTLSASSDSTSASTSVPRMGSYFSFSQWQELELQALIFRYMLAGAAVPSELLHPIKKSLLQSSSYFLQHYPHYDPALALQSGYWGRVAMDPEPGRCRRTDGKKWRCSRDVVSGQKYCERHMHRGRNRSRKPVELPTLNAAGGGGSGSGGGSVGAPISMTAPSLASASLSSRLDFHLDQSFFGTNNENKSQFGIQGGVSGDGKSGGHILRCHFNDWPTSLEKSDIAESSVSSSFDSMTCLYSSSDVSLKLSTG